MNRPKFLHVGGTLYWTIRTRNPDTQVLKDADSTPTVAIRKNGASTGDSVTVTKRSATTGIYDCSYNPAGEVEGDEFTVEETATVTGTTTGSATYSASWEFTVLAVERGTDSAALATGVNVTQWGGTAVDSANVLIDGAITAAKLATDAITAAKIATDAITAAKIAADAVAEIQSGLASQTSVDTLASYVDTEVAAIKAKTDNLPADPADASDIATAFGTVNSTLTAIAGYIDTEVAAIKAKTDNLPADPADQSALEAAITAAVAPLALQTSVDTVEAEIAKIPKSGETRRYTQVAANEGNKTADVSIGVPL